MNLSIEENKKNYINQMLHKCLDLLYNTDMKVDDLNLAINLRKMREYVGISQYELSKRSKVTTASISRIEAGLQKNVQLDKLVALCNALDCSIFDLLTDTRVSILLNQIREYIKH